MWRLRSRSVLADRERGFVVGAQVGQESIAVTSYGPEFDGGITVHLMACMIGLSTTFADQKIDTFWGTHGYCWYGAVVGQLPDGPHLVGPVRQKLANEQVMHRERACCHRWPIIVHRKRPGKKWLKARKIRKIFFGMGVPPHPALRAGLNLGPPRACHSLGSVSE